MHPFFGPGSSCRPTYRFFATPNVGQSSCTPKWQASPKRRGWARPWPSVTMTSGREEKDSSAGMTTGSSRKDSSPGTYGNGTSARRRTLSTITRSGMLRTTIATCARPSRMLTSTPATVRGGRANTCSRTCTASRRWSSTACLGDRFHECGCRSESFTAGQLGGCRR